MHRPAIGCTLTTTMAIAPTRIECGPHGKQTKTNDISVGDASILAERHGTAFGQLSKTQHIQKEREPKRNLEATVSRPSNRIARHNRFRSLALELQLHPTTARESIHPKRNESNRTEPNVDSHWLIDRVIGGEAFID